MYIFTSDYFWEDMNGGFHLAAVSASTGSCQPIMMPKYILEASEALLARGRPMPGHNEPDAKWRLRPDIGLGLGSRRFHWHCTVGSF
jgi:hypothetical protein